MNANVGGGVFVGGSSVNVGINVGDSMAVGVNVTGWKGVEVGEAFDACVTSISVGGIVCACGEAQEARKNRRTKKLNRSGIFINLVRHCEGDDLSPEAIPYTVMEIASSSLLSSSQ